MEPSVAGSWATLSAGSPDRWPGCKAASRTRATSWWRRYRATHRFCLAISLHGCVERWYTAGADLAVAKTGRQPHPVFCLCRRSLLPHLTAFLAGGGRKIDAWYAALQVAEVCFDDEADAFANINTPEELAAFESSPPA